MIDIQNLSKRYGKQTVLKDINLSFQSGQSIALIGPNGSGKTTLIKIILGLVIPDGGNIYVHEKDIRTGPEYRKEIGYMPQMSRFPEQMKVHQLFSLMKDIRSDVSEKDYDLTLYEHLKIDEIKNKNLGSLSGGMKQQVSAVLAFYFNPSVLILDEPTAALDPLSNEILKTKIRKSLTENKLIITTSHILNDLEEICNHVVYLMEGKMEFNESIEALKEKTSENKLNKMVVTLLQKNR